MQDRENKGIKISIFGIIINIILFVVKLMAGLFSNSTAIIGEAFNNLLDSVAFIISILGFKITKKPNNHYYPFGYGRVEYISGFVISILTILVGVELVKVSYVKIFSDYTIIHSKSVLLVLGASIIAKLIIGLYSNKTAKQIESLTLKALAEDSFSDMMISCATLVSYLLSYYYNLKLDGYMGMIVALIIVYSGMKTMLEISKPLIGGRDDVKVNSRIRDLLLSGKHIVEVHDLQVHSYGKSRIYCSACAILDKDMKISETEVELDQLQNQLELEFGNIDMQIGFRYRSE